MKAVELVEKNKEFDLPTIAQTELTREAQILMDLLDERAILSKPLVGECTSQYIAVAQTVDLDKMLYGIYHELGHIKNGDTEGGVYTWDFNGEHFIPGQTISSFSQDHPKLSAYLNQVKEYVDIAKAKLDKTSQTGKMLINEIQKTSTFWNPPQDPKQYVDSAIGRAQESRADLFAVEQLFEQKRLNPKRLDPIMFQIRDYGTNDKDYLIIERSKVIEDVHPSFLERAFYMAGYLFSKGVDVNKELRHWENFGKCTDVRRKYKFGSRLHEPVEEMGDFTRAYKAEEKARHTLAYKLWKAEKTPQLNASNGGQGQLVSELQRQLNVLRENPENRVAQKEALFTYNYLRELTNTPVIESVGQIDKEWLEQINYDVWKKGAQAKLLQEGKNTLNEQIIYLAYLINFYAPLPREVYQKEALYLYNYLRELLGQPIVKSIGSKEKEWLEQIKKQYS